MRSSPLTPRPLGRFVRLAGALALALVGCGSGGGKPAPGGRDAGRDAPAAADAGDALGVADAGLSDATSDAGPVFSCAIAGDAGATCLGFDPGSPDLAGVCAAQAGGALVDAGCPTDGGVGGCHVPMGSSGYTLWSYAPQTIGAVMIRCEHLGTSYVSP